MFAEFVCVRKKRLGYISLFSLLFDICSETKLVGWWLIFFLSFFLAILYETEMEMNMFGRFFLSFLLLGIITRLSIARFYFAVARWIDG